MEEKIAVLTEKLYKEGVEKGEEEKKLILNAAREEGAKIRSAANKEAEKILAEAKKQAEELRKNIESEIKLSTTQAISSLKQKISNLLLAKTIDENITSVFSDPGFLTRLIEAIVKNWKFGHGQEHNIRIVLSDTLKSKLEKSLEKSFSDIMKKGVTISFSKNVKGGFNISASGSSYKISLTDNDFIDFFKEYLKPRTRSYLFKE